MTLPGSSTPSAPTTPSSPAAPGGGAGGTVPPATTPAAGQPPASGAQAPWYGTTITKDTSRALVGKKNWTSHDDVYDAYAMAEARLGADPKDVVKIASPKDTVGRRAMFEQLGCPKEASGYGIEVEGGDKEALGALLGVFHEHGLNVEQAQGIAAGINAQAAALEQRQASAFQAKSDGELRALKQEWAGAFEANEQIAGQGIAFLWGEASTPEQQEALGAFVETLEKSMGYGPLMKKMHEIGQRLLEHRFVTGGGTGPNGLPQLSPADAEKELQKCMSSTEFMERLNRKEEKAVAMIDHLKRCKAAGKPDINLG